MKNRSFREPDLGLFEFGFAKEEPWLSQYETVTGHMKSHLSPKRKSELWQTVVQSVSSYRLSVGHQIQEGLGGHAGARERLLLPEGHQRPLRPRPAAEHHQEGLGTADQHPPRRPRNLAGQPRTAQVLPVTSGGTGVPSGGRGGSLGGHAEESGVTVTIGYRVISNIL